ncbi:MAG: peptidyl-tRNA hydrolase [Thermoprotei archaeon]|nr:MAG: peptidyl-tRNA hydrolase [Thermoprotei archaeon]RLF00309.1 MAG: peptidyl-tRNA hydrolase [Thermoprotei archaeon]
MKQVIVVRTDIKMSRGKIAAQVAHAAVIASEKARADHSEWWREWFYGFQKKIVLEVRSENELLEIYRKAKESGLPVALVRDKGLTEIPPNTLTAVAIGPAPSEKIDKITGSLKLLK